jgi:hypothetical protein
MGWPDLGRAWILAWAEELSRDMAIITTELAAARGSQQMDEARTLLENGLWRLDSAREKLHALIALIFGVPSFHIGTDKKQTLSFKPDEYDIRAKLKELQDQYPSAADLLKHDSTLKGSLLLRHQIAHSLAPVVNSVSLTWFEVGFISRGGVDGYEAKHLPAKGLKQMTDVGAEALMARSLRIAESGLRALTAATVALADLTIAGAQLEPPPIIWYVTELKQSYADRNEASALSRDAAGLPPHPMS